MMPRPMIKPVSLQLPGQLIAVEGLDGSGKSTQIHLVRRWLELEGYKVFFTAWNSSALVKKATQKGKKRLLLTPTTFCLIHSTDFADRYERQILPLLRAGYIVLCDRYYYTAFARDITRGCNPEWVQNLYSFAVKPDITFWFRVPLETALGRILGGRQKLKYFEAGMDMRLADNERESFAKFQALIHQQYERMSEKHGFTVMDAALPIETQQQRMRRIIAERIDLPAFKLRAKGRTP